MDKSLFLAFMALKADLRMRVDCLTVTGCSGSSVAFAHLLEL